MPLGLAQLQDPYRLYELAVQNPESEVDFMIDTFTKLRGRSPATLREDFCGTAAISCEWVARGFEKYATGVDVDPHVLAWSRSNRLERLGKDAGRRIRLVQSDVLNNRSRGFDAVAAMNFSYWLFVERAELGHYFRSVRDALNPDGVFFLDAYGGYDAFRVITEQRTVEAEGIAFDYIWEQERYDPITGGMACHIHFQFRDGSRIERAFSYVWRLWTLPEIRDLLAEAGFERVTCYWQGWDENGEADGVFVPATEAEADAGWICYLTAER